MTSPAFISLGDKKNAGNYDYHYRGEHKGVHTSGNGTMLHTDKGDINLKAGKNSYRSVEKHSKHKTGLMGSGGWGVFLGSRRQSGETELNIKALAPTLVGAIDGNIHIQAGGHYDGTGALVHAGREGGPLTKEQWLQMSEAERNRAGNIYFSAESGSLRAAAKTTKCTANKQTGFTANLGGAVVNVAQTALQTMKTLGDDDNARVRTMNTFLVKRIRRSTADSRAQQHVLERTNKGERKSPKVRKRGL